jgi:hypothetical protein
MRNACLPLVVLMACLGVVPAEAEDLIWHSGNTFLSTCSLAYKTSDELTEAQLITTEPCLPYVRGLDDGMGLLRARFCEPDNVTNGQLLQILVKFIRDNPEKAHLRTAVLYLAAMEKAFPCPAKK